MGAKISRLFVYLNGLNSLSLSDRASSKYRDNQASIPAKPSSHQHFISLHLTSSPESCFLWQISWAAQMRVARSDTTFLLMIRVYLVENTYA